MSALWFLSALLVYLAGFAYLAELLDHDLARAETLPPDNVIRGPWA